MAQSSLSCCTLDYILNLLFDHLFELHPLSSSATQEAREDQSLSILGGFQRGTYALVRLFSLTSYILT